MFYHVVTLALEGCWAEADRTGFVQIADEDRKISTLYDMLDYQDATNKDNKGLPFTVSVTVRLRCIE